MSARNTYGPAVSAVADDPEGAEVLRIDREGTFQQRGSLGLVALEQLGYALHRQSGG